MKQDIVEVYMEESPNPNALKFVTNKSLVPAQETYDFDSVESAAQSPLAQLLFSFPFVQRVFLMRNFVSVTKAAHVDWHEVQNELRETIKSFLKQGQQAIISASETETTSETATQTTHNTQEVSDSSDLTEKIKQVLDEYVKPAVARDGGAIAFDSYEKGTVKVILQGACSGCPSSTLTLKAGIENLLKNMIPQVKNVEAING